jgi:hypothetical protein
MTMSYNIQLFDKLDDQLGGAEIHLLVVCILPSPISSYSNSILSLILFQ